MGASSFQAAKRITRESSFQEPEQIMRESTSRAKSNFLSLSDGETLNRLIDRNIVLVLWQAN